MSTINFDSKIEEIGGYALLRIPNEESLKLPSRGMVMVEGTLNGTSFVAPLEPDGMGSHWLKVDKTLLEKSKLKANDSVKLSIGLAEVWPKPEVPSDFKKALSDVALAGSLWEKITPNAQWDWIRWIRATHNPETRAHRIEVSCSKLTKGMRRPCCFNRNMCTDPDVSRNWKLLEKVV